MITSNINIDSSYRTIPDEQVSYMIDRHEIYLSERENSDRYRLIFNLNPICTNILFNPLTEVVYKEGSEMPNILGTGKTTIGGTVFINNSDLTRLQAIRDTEYTHSGLYEDNDPLVYHCGMDMFSNYRLRLTESVPIQKISGDGLKGVFNTIEDYRRNGSGTVLETESPYLSGETPTKIKLHVVNNGNLLSFYEAYRQNLQERDGWFGFSNQSVMEIYHTVNEKPILLNKIMNNNKPCEQIDMYPDRSLYSFVPKINRYKGCREENNWDFCITYPYSSTTKPEENCDILEDSESGNKGLKIIAADIYVTDNGTERYFIQTAIKNNFKDGDTVKFYNYDGEEATAFVKKIGDENGYHKDTIFQVDVSSLDFDFEMGAPFYVVKCAGIGVPCEYYFRIFKKVPNMKYLTGKDDSTEPLTIDEQNASTPELAYQIGKMGFARNIYGDQQAQLLYTDDVITKRLRDNRGRKISEVFLTLIKRNAGHDEWYNNDPGNDKVEFSHCFGPVSSGLDIKFEDYDTDLVDYNIHCLHNISDDVKSDLSVTFPIPTAGIPFENDITIENDCFLGDIVEFNPMTAEETILENVYHRFNTVQRETKQTLEYDILEKDDFTFESANTGSSFSVKTGKVESVFFPEGYYYQPHHRIQLREYDTAIQQSNDIKMNCRRMEMDADSSGMTFTAETMYHYPLVRGDKVVLKNNGERYICDVLSNQGQTLVFQIHNIIDGFILDSGATIYSPAEAPEDATFISNSGLYVWRNLRAYQDSENAAIQKAPFANGAIYRTMNITFFLRRQDPDGIYRLNYNSDYYGQGTPVTILTPKGYVLPEVNDNDYVEESDFEIC